MLHSLVNDTVTLYHVCIDGDMPSPRLDGQALCAQHVRGFYVVGAVEENSFAMGTWFSDPAQEKR